MRGEENKFRAGMATTGEDEAKRKKPKKADLNRTRRYRLTIEAIILC